MTIPKTDAAGRANSIAPPSAVQASTASRPADSVRGSSCPWLPGLAKAPNRAGTRTPQKAPNLTRALILGPNPTRRPLS